MIVVAGGSGRLGRLIVARLLAREQRVVVVVRDVDRARELFGSAVEVVGADVRRREGLDAAVAGAETVISVVHGFLGGRGAGPEEVDERGNMNLIDATVAVAATATAGAQFVLMSVSGAAPDHPLDLFRAKYAAEQHLRASTVAWAIVRAPAYLETWLEILAQTAGTTGRPLVFGRGDQPIPFVSAEEVAHTVIRATTDPSLRGRIVDLVGEPITMNQLARALQEARHWDGSVRHLPRTLLRILAMAAVPVSPAFARQNRAALEMDTGRSARPGAADARPSGASSHVCFAAIARKHAAPTVEDMAELFSFQECLQCGERHPVLSDGRMSIHFIDDGSRCLGSERRRDEPEVSSDQASVLESHLSRALNDISRRRAS
jgi:NADH dehydrogenase